MKSQDRSDLTQIVISARQWGELLATEALEFDRMIIESQRGEALTAIEAKKAEFLCGHLRMAAGVFSDLVKLGENVVGRPLPEDWNTREIR